MGIRAVFGWMVLVALAAVSRPLVAQDLDQGLVAYYAFEENAEDSGPSGHDGTVVGAPNYVAGVRGRAMTFDGVDDAVTFPGIPNAAFAGNFSISWFMRVPAHAKYAVLSKRGSCNLTNAFDIRTTDETPSRTRFSAVYGAGFTDAFGRALTPGQWTHVAVVRDGGTVRVYTDGVAGTANTTASMNLSAVTAPFGISITPCITFGDGTVRFAGQIDELRLYDRALSAGDVDTLSGLPSLSVSPATASVGGQVSYTASDLVLGRTYTLRMGSRTPDTVLDTFTAGAGVVRRTFQMPDLPAGDYRLALQYSLFLQTRTHATAAATIAPRLKVSVSTANPQAGKSMVVNVGNLAPGSLQLRYAGRVVAGPVNVAGASQALRFVAPADIPASLPANVTLVAELLSGRLVARNGSTTVNVAAPFTGVFALPTGIASNNPTPRPRDRVQVSGQLNLADGTTPNDVDVSVFWVGNDGRITPLPTTALQVNADGTFNLSTRPVSLAGMTAVNTAGPGRLRVVTRRINALGRPEYSTVDGPTLSTVYDTDPQRDITLLVRARGANNQLTPIEGAYIVVEPTAPLQGFQLPPPPPSGGGTSQYQTTGAAVSQLSNASFASPSTVVGGLGAVNQASNVLGGVSLPPPPCGLDLYRRYTDAQGRASFNVEGETQGAPGSFFALSTLGFVASDCNGAAGCGSALPTPASVFDITVFTLHKGAGFLNAEGSESPTRLRVTYFRDTGLFRFTDLRTGEVTEQTGSANYTVIAPVQSLGSMVTIEHPFMYRAAPAGGVISREIGPDGRSAHFSGWAHFSTGFDSGGGLGGGNGNPNYTFTNLPPRNIIAFRHRADAGGPLTQARLVLEAAYPGQPELVLGDFAPVANPLACNIQDDGSTAGRLLYQLELDPALWRFPGTRQLIPYADLPVTLRGRIEYRNQQGVTGTRPVSFTWRPFEEALCQFDDSQSPPVRLPCPDVLVDDTILGSELSEAQPVVHSNREDRQTFPSNIDGNQFRGDPVKRNNSRVIERRDGQSGGSRSTLDGQVDRQLNKGASDRSKEVQPNGAALVSFGSQQYETVLDKEIPLLQVTFGIPGLAGADAYASLRLLAQYLYFGQAGLVDGDPYLKLATDAAFGVGIAAGVDLDVLFGLLFDAGFGLAGLATSSMQALVETRRPTRVDSCLNFTLDFFVYFDPCPICPTPAIEETYNIFREDIFDCPDIVGRSPLLNALAQSAAQKGAEPVFDLAMQRSLRRHPAVSFDTVGNGSMLVLDNSRRLVARALVDGAPGAPTVLSSAPVIRNARIVHYAPNRAIAVWAENALTAPQIQALNPLGFASAGFREVVSRQRLAWAQFNGTAWSPKQFLTSGAAGEGFVDLAACRAGVAGCPQAGEVFLVFQRNTSADHTAPAHRVFSARWQPITGWSTPAAVSTTGGVQDMAPVATYVGSAPLAAWVRSTGTDPILAPRRLVTRFVGTGPVQVHDLLPPGANALTLSGRASVASAGERDAFLAFFAPDPTTGPIGIGQALHVGSANCDTGAGTCTWQVRRARVQGEPESAVYADRPTLRNRGRIGVARVFGLKPKEPDTVDKAAAAPAPKAGGIGYVGPSTMLVTAGLLNGAGDQMRFSIDYATGEVTPIALTVDGLGYYGLVAAFDAVNERVISIGSPNPAAMAPPLMARLLKSVDALDHRGAAKSIAVVDGVELSMLPELPDLAIIGIGIAASQVAPGQPLTANVTISNLAAAYDTATDGIARLELRWNAPTGTGQPLAQVELASLAAGASRTVPVAFTTPAAAFSDESHVLYARIVPAASLAEVDGGNNEARFEFAGLPIPEALRFVTAPGVAAVQLNWDAPDDPRVIGWRVYRRSAAGDWEPLGATLEKGFLDLSAQFGVPRTYAVASYSARGVESSLSESLSAAPEAASPAPGDDALFRNGFETPTP